MINDKLINREQEKIIIHKTFGFKVFISLIVIALIISAIKIVPAGYEGVPLLFGAIQDWTEHPGIHFVFPIIQDIIPIETRTQLYSDDAETATKDLQEVKTTVALNYRLNWDKVSFIYQNVGLEYRERIIIPAIQESVKVATAQFNADSLIDERPKVKEIIKADLVERLALYNIEVETISIVNFAFSDKFNEAIEAKMVAQQEKLQAEIILQTITIQAQQKIEKAKGESEAIRIINEQLLKSPQYISYILAEKWNGELPLATGNGAVPFIDIWRN